MDHTKLLTPETTASLANSNETHKVLMITRAINPHDIKRSLMNYKFKEGQEFLLLTYPKNGTHIGWEIMEMLVNGSAEYVKNTKTQCMLDLIEMDDMDQKFPPPRVINSHYRLDLLPEEFQNRKTVLVLRNPKDSIVSNYYMFKVLNRINGDSSEELTFEECFNLSFQRNVDFVPYGDYFSYTEYMWNLSKTHPDMIVLFFEDIKRNPIENIKKLNEFLGTGCSDEVIQEIADAVEFSKMKIGKAPSEKQFAALLATKDVMENQLQGGSDIPTVYRKGMIGDWKNHFTVAQNEQMDKLLAEWEVAKDIPFIYE